MKYKKYQQYKKVIKKSLTKKGLRGKVRPKVFYSVMLAAAFLVALPTIYSSLAIQKVAASVHPHKKSLPQWKLEQEVRQMTMGHPINAMLSYIFTKDEVTVAYLIGIAKKESNWGKIAPSKEGKDCYNYWGFKGHGSRGVAAGHTCFGSPEEAVDTVASRIDSLVYDYNRTTPEEMVVWKCGYSCKGHSSASVDKWIRDVAFYKGKVEEAKN